MNNMKEKLVLEVENLTKYYGKKLVLNNINLDLQAGAFYGFVGLNGAGKSTFIRCITGLTPFSKGRIRIFDMDIKKDNMEIKKKSGVLMENMDDVFIYLTGNEYLHFLGDLTGLEQKVVSQKIEELKNFFSMENNLDQIINNYSKGMKKKIAIMGLLLRNPDFYILDEPFEGLDPLTIIRLKNILRALTRRGKTIFLTSHILSYVEDLSDKIFILHQGEIVFESEAAGLHKEIKNKLSKETFHSLEDVFINLTQDAAEQKLSWI